MDHTFLFEEATWRTNGILIDNKGTRSNVEGKAVITHTKKLWRNVGFMEVLSNPTTEFQNIYEIIPFIKDHDTTHWISMNPTLGKLTGNFIIVEDSILSLYQSESKEFFGMEYMKKIDKNYYQNCGTLMKGNDKISSWSVELKK